MEPSEQWRSLKETYSSMSENELQAMAKDACDLTDIAKQVLQSEISGRGLSIARSTLAARAERTRGSQLGRPVSKVPFHEIFLQGPDEGSTNDADSSSKSSWSCDACGHQWNDDDIKIET